MLLNSDLFFVLLPLLINLAGPAAGTIGAPAPAATHQTADARAASPAASGVFFPGYASPMTSYSSPIEKGNLLTVIAVEQGIALGDARSHVVPYAGVRLSVDEQGLDWNNKAVMQVGVKYVRRMAGGVVQAGGGYAFERRLKSDFRAEQPLAFAEAWFGWGMPWRSARQAAGAFPGSAWGSIGNDTPAEKNNVITRVYVEQGAVIARIWQIDVVPFVEMTGAADSQGLSWNNLQMFGEGLRISRRVAGAHLEIAAIYQQEHRWVDDTTANALGGLIRLRRDWRRSPAPSKTSRK
jgi:hypothetical protein